MVGVNTLTSVDRLAYSNHCQFWFRLGRSYPNIDFALNNPNRTSIDRMRQLTAEVALENEMDYVLFLDDDVLLQMDKPENNLQGLLDCKSDIAAGWTIIRGYPFENMFFKLNEEKNGLHKVKTEDIKLEEDGNILCDAVGFSFCLISCNLLKKVPAPWFVTGSHHTEDIYFCAKSRDLFPETTIKVNPRVVTGHILGSEVITPETKPFFKKYMEDAYPDLTINVEPPLIARGDNYVKSINL